MSIFKSLMFSKIVTEATDIDFFLGYYLCMFIYGGDPLSHLPIGQESMEMKKHFSSVTPALKGFIINRFI